MDRRGFFGEGLRELAADFLRNNAVGRVLDRQLQGLANVLDPRGLDYLLDRQGQEDLHEPPPAARPPGALADAEAFDAACTRCGDCIEACPYGVLYASDESSGPLLDPNHVACHLCPDFPCIAACSDGALLPLAEGYVPRFGQAELQPGRCANLPFNYGFRPRDRLGRPRVCRSCRDACPVEGVVRFGRGPEPEFSDQCTGCGQCVEACPALPRAIKVVLDEASTSPQIVD